jgi:hypothetical protein
MLPLAEIGTTPVKKRVELQPLRTDPDQLKVSGLGGEVEVEVQL